MNSGINPSLLTSVKITSVRTRRRSAITCGASRSSGMQISAVATTCNTPATRNEVPSNALPPRTSIEQNTPADQPPSDTQPTMASKACSAVRTSSCRSACQPSACAVALRDGRKAKPLPSIERSTDRQRRPERILARPDAGCAIRMSPSRRLPTARFSRVSLEFFAGQLVVARKNRHQPSRRGSSRNYVRIRAGAAWSCPRRSPDTVKPRPVSSRKAAFGLADFGANASAVERATVLRGLAPGDVAHLRGAHVTPEVMVIKGV